MHDQAPALPIARKPATQAAVVETGPDSRPGSADGRQPSTSLLGTPAQADSHAAEVPSDDLLTERPAPDNADQVASAPPDPAAMGESARDDAGSSQIDAAVALLTVPAAAVRAPAPERGLARRHTPTPYILPYVTRSSRGTWLFASATNAGANS